MKKKSSQSAHRACTKVHINSTTSQHNIPAADSNVIKHSYRLNDGHDRVGSFYFRQQGRRNLTFMFFFFFFCSLVLGLDLFFDRGTRIRSVLRQRDSDQICSRTDGLGTLEFHQEILKQRIVYYIVFYYKLLCLNQQYSILSYITTEVLCVTLHSPISSVGIILAG